MHAPHLTRTLAVHTVAWMLVGVAAYDGAGLAFAGGAVATTPTYAALQIVPGGMRTWGVVLLAGAIAVAWGIGRDGHGHPRALNITLSVGVGYYLMWALVIPGTWFWLGQIPAWGALSKHLLLAGLYFACARASAPPPRSSRTPDGSE